jgi:hypothetical protein
MSNATGAFGLRPVRKIDGSPYNGATQKCYISGSYATALFIGDGVIFDTTLTDKDPTGRYPTIIQTTGSGGVLVRGVIVSFDPDPDDLSKIYNPASNERYANVCMDPEVIYQIRDDGAGTPGYVYPGQNATITVGSGSTTTGLSGMVLDTSTPTTTQNYQLHIIGRADKEDNALDDYCVWEVLLNTSDNATGRFLGVTAS